MGPALRPQGARRREEEEEVCVCVCVCVSSLKWWLGDYVVAEEPKESSVFTWICLICSLACQPLHPRKEGLVSRTQCFCVEWVDLTHKHTLDNALIMSETMDCAGADTKWRGTVAARCLKQVAEKLGYSAPTAIATLYDRMYSCRNVFSHLV